MISFLSYDTTNMVKCADRVHLVWQNIRDHAPRSSERAALRMSRHRRGYTEQERNQAQTMHSVGACHSKHSSGSGLRQLACARVRRASTHRGAMG